MIREIFGSLKGFDRVLFFSAILILMIGIMAIGSSTQAKSLPFGESFVLRQMTWMGAAILLLVLIVSVSYQKLIDLSYILYAINVVLLVLVLIVGQSRLGAQRWFAIGSFAFQPSEFMKLGLIMALSNYVGQHKGVMDRPGNFFGACIILFIPFCLVLIQPDLGTSLLLVPIFFSIMLVGGADTRYLIGMALAGLAGFPFFWHFLHGYQRQRLLVFLNPNIDPLGAGYTIIQSKIAVGSGGLFGKGWMSGTQNQLNFLPERHTDFIFSVIGEEWGFFGAIVLLLIYYMIVKRMFNISESTSDIFGKSLVTGVAVMLSVQVVINISMTIGLMPVVGIPLPMISYGGSSLFTSIMALAIVLNVGMRRSRF